MYKLIPLALIYMTIDINKQLGRPTRSKFAKIDANRHYFQRL